jgi:protease I
MAKIAVIIGDGFEDSELVYPYYRSLEAGFQVDLVGPEEDTVYHGKHGVPMRSNVAAGEAKAADYVALVIPGGRAPDHLRLNQDLVRLVRQAMEQDKVVAAICHGPQMLIEADVVRGRKATSYAAVATDLKNAGAVFVDQEVVVDGKLVTSRTPRDLPAFCREMLRLLGK